MTTTATLTVQLDRATPCASLADASRMMRKWIESNGYGASDLRKSAGVVRRGRIVVARISYNGRVWDRLGSEISMAECDHGQAHAWRGDKCDLTDGGVSRAAYLTVQSNGVAWSLISGPMPARVIAEGVAADQGAAMAAAMAAARSVGWVR